MKRFFMKQILKSVLYLESSETSDLILYPHLFLVDGELSLICSVHKEGWSYKEAATGEAAKRDELEARRGQDLSPLGDAGLEVKGGSPGGQWVSYDFDVMFERYVLFSS